MPVHYDLDQVERQIRTMFAKARTQPMPPHTDKLSFDWQNRTEDIMVAYMRWGMSQEMEGVEPETQGHLIGVLMGELAAQYLNTFNNPEDVMTAVSIVMQGFTDQLNCNIARILSGDQSDMRADFSPVEGGHA